MIRIAVFSAGLIRGVAGSIRCRIGLFLLMAVFWNWVIAQELEARYPIIPYPASLAAEGGEFVVTPVTKLGVASPIFRAEAGALNQYFENYFGRPLKVSGKGDIVLKYDGSITAEEGYGLTITPGQVVLSARTAAGMFMGVQTLRQLLPVAAERAGGVGGDGRSGEIVLPAVCFKDAPAFSLRGIHFDVSRRFFFIRDLPKFIDVMALYKFNTFQLHLTD